MLGFGYAVAKEYGDDEGGWQASLKTGGQPGMTRQQVCEGGAIRYQPEGARLGVRLGDLARIVVVA